MADHPALVYRQELSPVHFLERSGLAHAHRTAVIDGEVAYTWRQWRARSRRLASALLAAGVRKGDRIALLATNSEPLLLAHFGVPLAGAVLVAINTRLSAREIAYIVEHSGATWIIYSPDLAELLTHVPSALPRMDTCRDFEDFLASGREGEPAGWPSDEYDLISINYTSGTTARPKGVMYHHRGAYLNALAMALDHRLSAESSYLWTVPMFHCNGWTFPWALAAVGGTSVCIPRIDPPQIWQHFEQGVTHFCAAPTVLNMLVNHPAARRLERPVRLYTAGSPPSPTIIRKMAELNFELEHVYGLTETYGPFTISMPPCGIDALSSSEQARLKARQGVPNVCAGEVRVVDPHLRTVPPDGATLGEVVMRGNVVMKGYFGDEQATQEAFAGGWFHSGDLAVTHPDGSIELRDRKKDMIISGGENISSIEVEQAVASHPAVMECAVIAIPDDQWGEVPKAFVTLKPGAGATENEIIAHCRAQLASYKIPKSVQFSDLPKTSTGKIQKYVLREQEWQGRDKRIN